MRSQQLKSLGLSRFFNREAAHVVEEEASDFIEELIPVREFYEYSDHLISVSRAWSVIIQKSRNGERDEELHKALNIWTQKFCSLGGTEAANHWDRFLECVVRNVKRPITLGCASCGKVSDDEKLMLSIVTHIQSKEIYKAHKGLAVLMHEPEMHHALQHLILFVSVMKESNAFIDADVMKALDESDNSPKQNMH